MGSRGWTEPPRVSGSGPPLSPPHTSCSCQEAPSLLLFPTPKAAKGLHSLPTEDPWALLGPCLGRGAGRASPLGVWAGLRAAGAAVSRPRLGLAQVLGVDLVVHGAEHPAGLLTCRGPATAGSRSVHILPMPSLGQTPFWTHPEYHFDRASVTPLDRWPSLRLRELYLWVTKPLSDTWSLAPGPPSTAKGIPCPRRCHCLQEVLWFSWLRWGPFVESPHSWVSPRWPPMTCRCCNYLSASHPRLERLQESAEPCTQPRVRPPQAAALTSTTFSAAVTP